MTETRFVTNHRDAQRATRLPRQKYTDMARRMPQRRLETDQDGNPGRPQTRVAVLIATRCRAINPAPWRGAVVRTSPQNSDHASVRLPDPRTTRAIRPVRPFTTKRLRASVPKTFRDGTNIIVIEMQCNLARKSAL